MISRENALLPSSNIGRVAILWRGDEEMRRSATPETSRFKAIFAALSEAGISAVPIIYEDDRAESVRTELIQLNGVLVWVNPIHEGRDRNKLNILLREVAASGVWVSAHPEVIQKMGTKEVLYLTRKMSWGTDTALYRTIDQMRAELPMRLAIGPRVIKRKLGNGGQGVWKVQRLDDSLVRVLDATQEEYETIPLDQFIERCSVYFEDGCVIDQAFIERLTEGVVRCYMAGDRCAGFGYQKVRALVDSRVARAEAGPRCYASSSEQRFQRLRRLMEDEWTAQLTSLLDFSRFDLPMIWDADFMLGPPDSDGNDTYVLGEINVSSVFPIPEGAPQKIARAVANRLLSIV